MINGQAANLIVTDATTGIPGSIEATTVQVYPNPASDKQNVEVSVKSKIQMIDMSGKLVVVEQYVNANQKQTIDVSKLAPGDYTIKIYNDKFVKMQKVVIEK